MIETTADSRILYFSESDVVFQVLNLDVVRIGLEVQYLVRNVERTSSTMSCNRNSIGSYDYVFMLQLLVDFDDLAVIHTKLLLGLSPELICLFIVSGVSYWGSEHGTKFGQLSLAV